MVDDDVVVGEVVDDDVVVGSGAGDGGFAGSYVFGDSPVAEGGAAE